MHLSVTVNAFRNYFLFSDLPAGSRLELAFQDDETTSIEDMVIVDKAQPATADGWYTLDGRKFINKPTAKGIYIYNGRKMIIK